MTTDNHDVPKLGLEHKLEYYGEGELACCTVCGCVEGSLLSHCPGYKLSSDAEQACYMGNVVDIKRDAGKRKLKPSGSTKVQYKLPPLGSGPYKKD